MTDAEIIKALPQITYGGRCTECKYGIYSGDDRCGIKGCKIARDALDLIRRQQAEIERLKSSELTEEMRAKCEKVIYKIRAEAIKEFAEKLKANFAKLGYKTNTHRKTCNVDFCDKTVNWVIHDITSAEIDNLVKEMTGEK